MFDIAWILQWDILDHKTSVGAGVDVEDLVEIFLVSVVPYAFPMPSH
jgi:hypothetical protein